MIRNILILVLAVMLSMGCGDDDAKGTDFRDIDVVTGLDLTDVNGVPIGRWREPNHNVGDIFVFPIPAMDEISLFSTPNSGYTLTEVWIVPATCLQESESNIVEESKNLSYTMADIEAASTRKLEFDGSSAEVRLDLSGLSSGFYKLFYLDNQGQARWTNIYTDMNVLNFTDLKFLDDACQE